MGPVRRHRRCTQQPLGHHGMDLMHKAELGLDIQGIAATHLQEVCSQQHSHVGACSRVPRQGIIWPELAEGQQLGEHLRVGLQCHLDVLTRLD